MVAFFNTHLDYVKYGPHQLLDGMPLADVMASRGGPHGLDADPDP